MKHTFKKFGMAAAVAAASAGYMSNTAAQTVADDASGDLALVPYYTVENNFVTGLHITNTSEATQVVKIRLRRGTDSLDALDWNVVLSPRDMYAGAITENADGRVQFQSFSETSCTVPGVTGGTFVMPDVYNEGAKSGYIEVIAMAQTFDEDQPIATAAKHVPNDDGVWTPRDCAAVRSNFLKDGDSATNPGNETGLLTWQQASTVTGVINTPGTGPETTAGANNYVDSDDALKVSWFIRDEAGGIEMGDVAVHIEDFLTAAAMTNQEKGQGFQAGDLTGFDFPDLNGGIPGAERGRYDGLRDALATASISNEWSANPNNDVLTNWVVTIPGQYTMLNLPEYIGILNDDDVDCARGTLPAANVGFIGDGTQCDFRDLPVSAEVTAYTRDEEESQPDDPLLDVSPSLPGTPTITSFQKETTVVTFGGRQIFAFDEDTDVNISRDFNQPFGWATLSVTPAAGDQAICEWDAPVGTPTSLADLTMTCVAPSVAENIPMIGFNAWVREVNGTSSKYGRAIGHTTVRR